LVRVLANRLDNLPQFVVAGDWLALIKRAQVFNQPDELQVIRISTGHTALTRMYPSDPRSGEAIDAVAVDRSGRYAVLTCCGNRPPCRNEGGFDVVSEGHIGHPGMEVLGERAAGEGIHDQQDLAIAGDSVAYGQWTVRCPGVTRVAIAAPGSAPTTLEALKVGVPVVVYDGRLVATAHSNTVQLTTKLW
jgi:hypothetical protein